MSHQKALSRRRLQQGSPGTSDTARGWSRVQDQLCTESVAIAGETAREEAAFWAEGGSCLRCQATLRVLAPALSMRRLL